MPTNPTRRTLTAAVMAATLVLAACGSDSDTAPAATVDEHTDEATDAEAGAATPPESAEDVTENAVADTDVTDADTATDAEDEPEPFDPDAEIHPADIEVREWGVGEVERPWESLILPDDFVLPATAHLVTWAPPEAPFDGGRHGGSGAFRLYEAEPEDVASFFTSRLPDQGWELDDEQQGDRGAWAQTWVTRVPWDGWDEDWKHDEFGVEVQVRLTYIVGEEDWGHHTMQMHYRAEWVRHRWDDE